MINPEISLKRTVSQTVVSCREVSKRLNCSKNTVTALIKIGHLEPVVDEKERTVGITPDSLARFWEKKSNRRMTSAPRSKFVPLTPEEEEVMLPELLADLERLKEFKNDEF